MYIYINVYYGRYYTFCPCKVSILFLMLQIKTEKRVVLRPKPCDFFYNLPFFDEMMRCFVCFSWYKSNFSRQRVFACGFTCVFFLVCFSLTFLLVFLLVFLRFFAWGFLLAGFRRQQRQRGQRSDPELYVVRRQQQIQLLPA